MGRPRNFRLEAQWRRRIADQEASGESVAEFCRRRGLQAGSFFRWRRILNERSALETTVQEPAPQQTGFLELRLEPCQVAQGASATGLEIFSPRGWRLIAPVGTDLRLLALALQTIDRQSDVGSDHDSPGHDSPEHDRQDRQSQERPSC